MKPTNSYQTFYDICYMEKARAVFKRAWGYQGDPLNLPVVNIEIAIPYYEKLFGLHLESTTDEPVRSAILQRDNIRIGFAENGGDASQDGCFFEVDNVENAFAELKANGLDREEAGYAIQKYGETNWKLFFVVAPDGLCYSLGERQI